eukprot:TRINITY_DN44050_c0_g1_i1.p1 TRINITY_DN44050_c0_g1~~TRINITY_DN44050_c0_g1_i1.p1  ORF type:complete len:419 (-),score=91.60 TRINITY_DN44050_c0_g1_i1:53-1309(-)
MAWTRGSAQDARSRDAELTPEVLLRWIVESLYLDEAIPKGGLVQWYYQVLTGVKLNHAEMTDLIEATQGVYTDPPVSKRLGFRCVLEEPPPGFQGFIEEDVDDDAVDPFIWDEAAELLASGGWPKTEDPVYKYVTVASWLQDASSNLKDITFGRLLHLIRLCTHHHNILGHRDGLLVPWSQSEEHERLANAAAGQPTSVKSDEAYVQNWKELQAGLRYFISISPQSEVEVSKLKLLFRSQLQKELSETVFGHTTMSKLLSDPGLGSDFVLENTPVSGRKGMQTSRLRIIMASGCPLPSPHAARAVATAGGGKGNQQQWASREAKPRHKKPGAPVGAAQDSQHKVKTESKSSPLAEGSISAPPGLDVSLGLTPGRQAEGTAAAQPIHLTGTAGRQTGRQVVQGVPAPKKAAGGAVSGSK